MKLQISYTGLRLHEQIGTLQSAFQDGALGRVVASPGKTISVDIVPGDEQTVIRSLQRTGAEAGFIILQDDESWREPDTRRYKALTPDR